MRSLQVVFLGLMLSVSAAASEVRMFGQGLPLPWPFPWAKDCPVNWQSMSGRYQLSDSAKHEQIDLKITVIHKKGFKLVRVSRLSSRGRVLSDGFNVVGDSQRTLSLVLTPIKKGEPPIWALIRLHYSNWDLLCDANTLVPIMTMEKMDATVRSQAQYRLVRMPER